MTSRSATNRGGERGLEKTTKQWKKDKKKTIKQKLEFNDQDNYIISLCQCAVTPDNWKIKGKGLTYHIEYWVDTIMDFDKSKPNKKKTREFIQVKSGGISWQYTDPRTGFIYVGNKKEALKLGLTSRYCPPSSSSYKFTQQTSEEIYDILAKFHYPLKS